MRTTRVAIALAAVVGSGLIAATPGLATVAPAAGGGAVDLGTLGGDNSDALAADAGLIVGWAETAPGTTTRHAFVFDASHTGVGLHDLGTLPGGGDSEAVDVSGGVVVGWSDVPGLGRHAFAYDSNASNPAMVDLGTLGGTNSAATAIDGTTVVGWSDSATGSQEAFAVDLGATPPVMQDLGPGRANDVSGDLVSVADGTSGYLYRLGGASGGRIDIASPTDTSEAGAQPLAVDSGWAVGVSGSSSPATPAAFAYDADAVDASIKTPIFPTPSAATGLSHNYAVGWTGSGTGLRGIARRLDDLAAPAVTLGAWTPTAVDGTAVVGDNGAGASYAINLGALTPRSRKLPGLGGGTWTHDVAAGLVAGSADVSGHRHAAAWRIFQTAVLTATLGTHRLVYGHATTLRAALAVAGATPIPGRRLGVYARPPGAQSWRHVATVTTGTNGTASLSVAPHRNTDYEVRFAGDLDWAGTRSHLLPLRVGAAVSASLSATRVRPGVAVTLRGGVFPWRPVVLQSYTDSGWHSQRMLDPNGKGRYSFRIARKHAGSYYFRVVSRPSSTLVSGRSGLRTFVARVPVPITRSLSKLPNVVLVLTDDQRPELLDRMTQVRTLLVRHGVNYTRMMVPTPACCPSRATILTGLLAHDSEVYSNGSRHGGWPTFHRVGDERRTIALALQRRGYRTALIGKYLNFYGPRAPLGYVPTGWDRFLAGRSANGGAYYNYSLANGARYGTAPHDYSVDVETRQSVDFIRSTPTGRPLFLYVAPFAPHTPAIAAPRYLGYWEGKLPSYHPPSVDDDMSGKPQWMQGLTPVPQEQIDAMQARQQDALMAVDDQVAALMNALKDTGRARNTLFIFTSDNGFTWGDHRLMAKDVPYTPAQAVPLVIRWDGHVSAGSTDRRLAVNADLAQTIARATGTRFTSDGMNLLGTGRRSGFVIEQTESGLLGRPAYCGYRTASWSFVQYSTGEQELYDLANDPYQLQNLADDPSYDGVRAQLLSKTRTACFPRPPGFSW